MEESKEGWIDERKRMDGRIGERMNGRERMKWCMDERIYERMNGWKEGKIGMITDLRMEGWIVWWIILINVKKAGRIGKDERKGTDENKNGWMKKWKDGWIFWRNKTRLMDVIKSERMD